jgi:hypothetical protein
VKLLRIFCCCLRSLLNLGVRERGRQYKGDSERERQRINPGVVVVLRHGTFPLYPLIPSGTAGGRYTSGAVGVFIFDSVSVS